MDIIIFRWAAHQLDINWASITLRISALNKIQLPECLTANLTFMETQKKGYKTNLPRSFFTGYIITRQVKSSQPKHLTNESTTGP